MENYHTVLNFKWGFSISALLALEAEELLAGESALGPRPPPTRCPPPPSYSTLLSTLPPGHNNQKCLWTLTNVPWGSHTTPAENHCFTWAL